MEVKYVLELRLFSHQPGRRFIKISGATRSIDPRCDRPTFGLGSGQNETMGSLEMSEFPRRTTLEIGAGDGISPPVGRQTKLR